MSAAVTTASTSNGFWASLGGGIRNGALWLGRSVKAGFNNYLVPALKKLWVLAKAGFARAWAFLKTAPGLGTLGCIIGTGIGISLLAIAHRDNTSTLKRVLLRIFAVVSFVLGAGALAAGITLGNL